MRKVTAIQDSDCHWYVIPSEMVDEFEELDEAICSINVPESSQADEKFNQKFSQYRTGGDLNNIQLYAEV